MEWVRGVANAGPLAAGVTDLGHEDGNASWAASRLFLARRPGRVSRDQRPLDQGHPHHCVGRASALVALVAAGAGQGLLQGLAGDDAEGAGDAGGDLDLLNAPRSLRAHVVVVVRLPADHHAEAGDTGEAPR